MKKLLSLMLAALVLVSNLQALALNFTLTFGIRTEEVRQAHERLQALGYYDGALTEEFNAKTQSAAKLFQRYNGLVADGKIGSKTWNRLFAADAVSKAEGAVPSVKMGDAGPLVTELQTRLSAYGYYEGDVDSVFGKSTQDALLSFQRRNGLRRDGIAGDEVFGRLRAGTVSPAPAPAVPVLAMGSHGPRVKELQARLAEQGWFDGKIDGVFGAKTRDAVRAFQKANGLKQDGKAGAETMEALRAGGGVLPPPPKPPSLRPGATGEAVKALQRELRDTYYYWGTIDGIYGAAVSGAVSSFQASASLKADGIYGEKTRAALEGRGAAIFKGGIPVRTLRSGMSGWDVHVLQQRLIALKYLGASHTAGKMDAATLSAVRALQRAAGLEETGEVGYLTRLALWPTQENEKAEEKEEAAGTPDDPFRPRTLKLGKYGQDVARLQQRLRAAGFLLGKADGIFGPETAAAVRLLQAYHGLKADGIVGPATHAVLQGYDISSSEPDTTVDTGKPAVLPPLVKLRLGDRGTQVKKLQQNLIALHYLASGGADGIFGPKTERAVKNLQKKAKLKPDGIVGPLTWVYINNVLHP